MSRLILALPVLFSSATVLAQAIPEPPPLPEAVPDAELAPEVVIIERGEDVIEEYRSDGRVYMVKITPAGGVPYYLIDSDGDGSLESFRNAFEPPEVVQWRLFRW